MECAAYTPLENDAGVSVDLCNLQHRVAERKLRSAWWKQSNKLIGPQSHIPSTPFVFSFGRMNLLLRK